MRILFVGNFNEYKNGRRFYDPNRVLSNGFVRNGHTVYHYSDRDIARASTFFHSKMFGVIPTNKRLLEVAYNFKPDFLFIGHADIIWNSTLRKIRSLVDGVRIGYRNGDPLARETNVEAIMKRADVVDAIFTVTAGDILKQFTRPNNMVSYIPFAVDQSIDVEQSFRHTELDYDLFFAISPSPPEHHRVQTAKALREALPEVRFKFGGFLGEENVWGAAYRDTLGKTRMGLNLSQQSDYYLYTANRLLQLTGNGLLTFIDRATGFNDFFGEDELIFYDSFDDLVEKIRYYKANDNERQRVAENGWRKSHASFNERMVAKYVIETTFQQPLSEDYAWPTRTYTD